MSKMKDNEEIVKDFLSIENDNLVGGKYSAISNDFFEKLKLERTGKLCEKYKIKPIQFTFEITNRCNCHCEHCGMSANSKTDKPRLSIDELNTISDELEKAGIISYAITGGEPFLEFENMCRFMKKCRGKLDVIKLISNGFWGEKVEWYFNKMEDAGLFDNRFVVPAIQLSIGEQSVPLEYVCNIIEYVSRNYSINQLHIGLIYTWSEKLEPKLEMLYNIYKEKFGEFPKNRVYITISQYKNYVEGQGEKLNVIAESVYDEIGYCDNTFSEELGKFVSPKIFMQVNGDCYPCEIFNTHSCVYLGNLFKEGIESVLEKYNSNKYVTFIKKYGTGMFREVIPEKVLKEKFVETPCMACEFCIKYCEKNKLLK